MICAQYQAQIRDAEGHTKTTEVLSKMIKSGEGMYCPQCQVSIQNYSAIWICYFSGNESLRNFGEYREF